MARAVIDRTGIDPALVEDVVMAQSYASSETPCVGRWAALQAGLPIEVPGLHLDRLCGGGLQAIVTAAMMVESGAADVVIADGVESMSNIECYSTDMRWGSRAGSVKLHDRLDRGRERSQPVERFGYISGMFETAENLAKDYGISREEADAYAVRSHKRAAAAWDEGRFKGEVVLVSAPQRKGDPVLFSRDEGVRPDSSMETLAKLRPLMKVARSAEWPPVPNQMPAGTRTVRRNRAFSAGYGRPSHRLSFSPTVIVAQKSAKAFGRAERLGFCLARTCRPGRGEDRAIESGFHRMPLPHLSCAGASLTSILAPSPY